jgi:hypothetical protein
MLRDLVACMILGAAFCVALWLIPWGEPTYAMERQREDFLRQRIEYLTRQVEMERQRADVSERAARACGGLLDALNGAMGVGP